MRGIESCRAIYSYVYARNIVILLDLLLSAPDCYACALRKRERKRLSSILHWVFYRQREGEREAI